MKWFTTFITSKIGQKFTMAGTGLFIVLFLIVHLLGNLQLLKNDGGMAFNVYAHFMSHNIFIEIISFGLYFFILLHAIQGIFFAIQNRKARGAKYKKGYSGKKIFPANNMALLGSLLFFFIVFHMKDFWWKYKYAGQVEQIPYGDHTMGNLYASVQASFSQGWIVALYLASMAILYFHLSHGFSSAFRTLGIHNKKYTPVVYFIGTLYSVLVCIGFAIIPIYFYFFLTNH